MHDRERIARLLQGDNHPAAPEKDALFEHVWNRTRRRRSKRLWAGSLSFAVGAAALAFVLLPHGAPPSIDEFTAKGGEVARVRAYCVSDCRPGDKLLFETNGLKGPAYLAAFSRRNDGAIIWYFPSAASESSRAIERDGLVSEGAVLGSEHTPGKYEVTFVVSDRPLSRDEVRSAAHSDGKSVRWLGRAPLEIK
jgi:hypothetical protein